MQPSGPHSKQKQKILSSWDCERSGTRAEWEHLSQQQLQLNVFAELQPRQAHGLYGTLTSWAPHHC